MELGLSSGRKLENEAFKAGSGMGGSDGGAQSEHASKTPPKAPASFRLLGFSAVAAGCLAFCRRRPSAANDSRRTANSLKPSTLVGGLKGLSSSPPCRVVAGATEANVASVTTENKKQEKNEKQGEKASSSEDQIDDAVLRMAMAMAEEEEGMGAKPIDEPKKEKGGGFDFNILIQAFWTFLIIYSFGSIIIGISQGRIQDRTGGDFTAYDFFDNIFAFKEWSWETSLGFNPIEAFNGLTKSKDA